MFPSPAQHSLNTIYLTPQIIARTMKSLYYSSTPLKISSSRTYYFDDLFLIKWIPDQDWCVNFYNLFCTCRRPTGLASFLCWKKGKEKTCESHLAHNDLSYLNSCPAKCSAVLSCLSSTNWELCWFTPDKHLVNYFSSEMIY